jgi:hypothetical protein
VAQLAIRPTQHDLGLSGPCLDTCPSTRPDLARLGQISCRARHDPVHVVPDRARAGSVPSGPNGHLYLQRTEVEIQLDGNEIRQGRRERYFRPPYIWPINTRPAGSLFGLDPSPT